jgi:hypothetical protein
MIHCYLAQTFTHRETSGRVGTVFLITIKKPSMEQDKEPKKKKTEDKKIKEPFPPENTPQPPQVMDTSVAPESNKDEDDSNTKNKPGK